jgi:dipeptidyl aminopeptidase/acylaminoacyl peptidase
VERVFGYIAGAGNHLILEKDMKIRRHKKWKFAWHHSLSLAVFFWVSTAIVGCGSNPLETTEDRFIQRPGVHRQLLAPSDMRYTIGVPPGYTGNEPVPLILALHYGGEVTPFYGGDYLNVLVGPALQDLGAIMVAPDAGSGGWTNAQSESDVIRLLDAVEANDNIDPKRRLITGFSMGGGGTWYIASRHQDRFSAAIPMAARPDSSMLEVDWRIPLLVIHSLADEVVPFGPVQEMVLAMLEKEFDIEMIVVSELTHFQTQEFVAPLQAAVEWVQTLWSE